MMKRINFWFILSAIFLTFLATSACENTFDPLEEKDLHFTMFGAFDLSKNVQWVRVMPVMDSLVWTSPKRIDAQVFLEQTRTGETVELTGTQVQFGGYYAWNFSTSYAIQEGEEYQLTAVNSEGNSSTVTFEMPMDFPAPTVEYYTTSESGRVYGTGVDTLVVADGIYDVSVVIDNQPRRFYDVRISHLEDVVYGENGDFEFRLADVQAIAEKFGVRSSRVGILTRTLEVASGNDDWPDVAGLTQEEIVLPEINSNVENGMGVVSGIVSKRVSF